MFKVFLDYPGQAEEDKIVLATTSNRVPSVERVIQKEMILEGQALLDRIAAAPYVIRYATTLVRSTRPGKREAPKFVKDLIEWGAGPRASQFLIRGGKALAAMDGRLNVSTQDIRDVALPVLRHRLAPNFQAQSEGVSTPDLIRRILDAVPEPNVQAFERASQAGREVAVVVDVVPAV